MRKIIICLVVLLSVSPAIIYADGKNPVSEIVLRSFQKEFANATNVSWTAMKAENLYHAAFMYNGEAVEALFNEDGELVSTSRLISEHQLPILAIKKLVTDYSRYKIRQVIEFTNDNETAYLATLYNEKETIVLKLSPDGSLQRIKKIKT
jgi:hypothetical protein